MDGSETGAEGKPILLRDGWLFTYEAAERLGLAQQTVMNYVSGGVIEGELVTLGRHPVWFIHEQTLESYRASRDSKRAAIARARALAGGPDDVR